MTIELWSLGRENNKLLTAAIEEYAARINKYNSFRLITIDNSKLNKNLPREQLLEKEAALIAQKMNDRDLLIALDDKGKTFTSAQFAAKLNQTMNLSPQKIIFLIGGSYGIADSLKTKSHLLMSLSAFTFPTN